MGAGEEFGLIHGAQLGIESLWGLHGRLQAGVLLTRADEKGNDAPMIALFHSQGGFSFTASEATS